MRVFLFVSKEGEALPLAQRVVEEGHRAILYVNDPSRRSIGDGIVERSSVQAQVVLEQGDIDQQALKEVLHPKPDCIVIDAPERGFGRLGDILRELGYPVMGGSSFGNQVTLDKAYGDRVMGLMGINSIEQKGIRVSTELWYNGEGVINVNCTMEETTLCNSGIGPETESMGGVVWGCSRESRIYKEGIGKVVPTLKRHNYRGPISLNATVSKDGLRGLTFATKINFGLFELYRGRVNDLLYSTAVGVARPIELRDGWGLTVRFALMPYPMEGRDTYSKGTPLGGIDKGNLKHLWFYDVLREEGQYVCAGSGGDLGVVSAGGESVREARRRVYRTLSNLDIPDVIYRTDIGERVPSDYAQLRAGGWL